MKEPKFIYNFPLPKGYLAITLGHYICFRCSKEELHNRRDGMAKIAHELVHFNQIQEAGLIKFYSKYLWDYIKNLIKYRNHKEAYMNIPYEVEAYAEEWEF